MTVIGEREVWTGNKTFKTLTEIPKRESSNVFEQQQKKTGIFIRKYFCSDSHISKRMIMEKRDDEVRLALQFN